MIRKIVNLLARFCALFYFVSFINKWSILCDIFYTYRIIKKFSYVGNNPVIMRKIRVLGGENITIGDNFYCYWGQRIEAYNQHNGANFFPKIVIGDNVSLNPDCHIAAINRIELHDGVLLASRVFITDHFHGNTTLESFKIPPQDRILTTKGAVIIKKNVWLGEGVVVMPGVTIGENTVIGANSVVTKDIPSNSVAVGVPASVIKQL